jgi:hypothetical protein
MASNQSSSLKIDLYVIITEAINVKAPRWGPGLASRKIFIMKATDMKTPWRQRATGENG